MSCLAIAGADGDPMGGELYVRVTDEVSLCLSRSRSLTLSLAVTLTLALTLTLTLTLAAHRHGRHCQAAPAHGAGRHRTLT